MPIYLQLLQLELLPVLGSYSFLHFTDGVFLHSPEYDEELGIYLPNLNVNYSNANRYVEEIALVHEFLFFDQYPYVQISTS